MNIAKNPKTGVFYYRKRVPEALRAVLGWELKRSLGTKDHREAKRRYPEASSWAERLLASAEAPTKLSQREIDGLAGEWYRRQLGLLQPDREQWGLELEKLDDLFDGNPTMSRQRREGQERYLASVQDEVDGFLREEAVVLDPSARGALYDRVFQMKVDLARAGLRRAMGDYRDPELDRMPSYSPPPRRKACRLAGLVDAWAKERPRPERTILAYRRRVQRFIKFIGHDDPLRIERRDVIRWKDTMLADGLAPETVKSHIGSLSTVLQTAIDNERIDLKVSPAANIKVADRRDPAKRKLPYTTDEVALILRATKNEGGWLRRLGWMLVMTGCRLGELTDARVGDIKERDGVWFLDVTADEDRRIKNVGSARPVPLHFMLAVELLDEIQAMPEGPLFPELKPDLFGTRSGTATKRWGNYIRRRLGLKDPRKAPAHACRHYFSDLCREYELEKPIKDALLGHSEGDVSSLYGSGYSLARLKREVENLQFPETY